MKKYSWSFNKNDELWNQDTFDTVEECIENAKKNEVYSGETIAVGECIPYVPYIDADDIIERIEEQAYEHAGEASEGWLSYSNDEKDRLTEQLTEVLEKWIKDTNNEPSFYHIEDIREITL